MGKMADLMETDEELAEFTLAEVMELTTLFSKFKENPPTDEEFCQELATKFSYSSYRSGKSFIKWEQVQTWFLDHQKSKAVKAICGPVDEKETVVPRPSKKAKAKDRILSLLLPRKYNLRGYNRLPDFAFGRPQRPKVSAAVMATELSELTFEALSAKDLAWYDVASFHNFRVLHTGELEVRIRFSGFGPEEDEWVNIKRVRERSVPLVPSECDRVNVGDHIMCFRDDEYLAIYADACIADVQKKSHDSTRCTCIFVVRYDLDNFEEKTTLDKLCLRPARNNNNMPTYIPQVGSGEGSSTQMLPLSC